MLSIHDYLIFEKKPGCPGGRGESLNSDNAGKGRGLKIHHFAGHPLWMDAPLIKNEKNYYEIIFTEANGSVGIG